MKKMKKRIILFSLMLVCVFVNAQTADEIIAKHIEKTGGIEAWKAVKSIKMEIAVSFRGQSQTEVHIRTKEGYSYLELLAVENNKINFVQEAFDGQTAWGSNRSTMEAEEKDEKTLKELKQKGKEFPSEYITYKKLGYTFKLLGEEKIEGIDCYKLELTKGKEEVDKSIHFFSKKDYMLIALKKRYKNERTNNILEEVCFYHSDFKKINGIILPCSKEQNMQGQTVTLDILYEINSKIDESIFEFEESSI
jgi:hypothetical protein